MKQFIRTFFLFALLTIPAYLVWLMLWGATPQKLRPNLITEVTPVGFTNLRFQEALNYGPVDALILGSSHAYRGLDPRIFRKEGIEIFNLGSTAQTPIQSIIVLSRFIDHLDPQLVILEVFPWGFTSDGVESSIDLIFNGGNINRLDVVRSIPNLKVINSTLYASILGKNINENSLSDQYQSGGFVEKEISYLTSVDTKLQSWVWNERQFAALDRIMKECNQRNIKLILIQAPVSRALYSSYSNSGMFDERMTRLGDYYNYNGLPILVDSLHFYDPDHLNQDGVGLFNMALIDTLLARGYFQ